MDVTFKFFSITGDSRTRVCNELSKCKIYDLTRNSEEWTTKLKLLIGDLQNMSVQIDDSEMITHILSNLPEKYQNMVDIIEY